MEKGQIVYKAKEVICLHCGEKQSLTSTNYAEWLDECVLFREEHKSCRKQELGKMTFEEWFEKWWGERTDGPYKSINVESIARAAWEAALTHDPAKAHAEPVAFAQVLENGDLRISANGLRVLSNKLCKSRVKQPLYLQPKAKKCEN